VPERRPRSLRRLLRTVAAGLAIGALVGLVVGGVCSRVAMRVIAFADDREDFGRVTSAGATVGDLTARGTLGVLGGGLALGILGGLLYVALRPWLPAEARLRTIAFGWIAACFGLFVAVEGNQEDFTFLHLGLSLGLFGLTSLLFGLAVPPLVDRLAPRSGAPVRGGAVITLLVTALALVGAAVAVKHGVEFANGTRIPG
jgi:hypothetical protein